MKQQSLRFPFKCYAPGKGSQVLDTVIFINPTVFKWTSSAHGQPSLLLTVIKQLISVTRMGNSGPPFQCLVRVPAVGTSAIRLSCGQVINGKCGNTSLTYRTVNCINCWCKDFFQLNMALIKHFSAKMYYTELASLRRDLNRLTLIIPEDITFSEIKSVCA